MINYRFKIDFCDAKILSSDICFVSGDVKSATLNFEFYNEGKRIDISDYTLSVRAKRSDGVVIASGGKIKDNTAVFTPESNIYAMPGELYVEIALCDASGRYATTKVITFEVIEGLGEAATEGADNLNVYVSLLKDAISAKESAEASAEIVKSVHPKIIDGVWWVYDADKGTLASTGINAEGYTPKLGIDYWTENDKAEIFSYVDEKFNSDIKEALEGDY